MPRSIGYLVTCKLRISMYNLQSYSSRCGSFTLVNFLVRCVSHSAATYLKSMSQPPVAANLLFPVTLHSEQIFPLASGIIPFKPEYAVTIRHPPPYVPLFVWGVRLAVKDTNFAYLESRTVQKKTTKIVRLRQEMLYPPYNRRRSNATTWADDLREAVE